MSTGSENTSSGEENAGQMMHSGHLWIELSEGKSACPHCGAKSWFKGSAWVGSCKHAFRPGMVGNRLAVVFQSEA